LRVVFERIETSDEAVQALAQVQPPSQQELAEREPDSRHLSGNLEGMEVDRRSNIRLDGEGGARATDNKTRYLSTGLALLVAAAAARPDPGDGAGGAGGAPGRG